MLHFWLKQILLCKAEVASPFVSSTHSDTGFKKKKKEKKNCSHILLLNRLHLLYWQTLKYSYSSELQRVLICITLIIFQRREPDVTDYTPVLRWCKCYIFLPLPLVPCCDPVGSPWQLQENQTGALSYSFESAKSMPRIMGGCVLIGVITLLIKKKSIC